MDALKSMKIVKSVISRSFINMVTSKVHTERRVTARRGRQSVQESPVVVSFSNKYTVWILLGGGRAYQGINRAARDLAPRLALLLGREVQRPLEQ